MAAESIGAVIDRLMREYAKRDTRSSVTGWGKYYLQPPPIEIRSGAIIPDPDRPGCYCIDANTESGLQKFWGARKKKWSDPQSGESFGYREFTSLIDVEDPKAICEWLCRARIKTAEETQPLSTLDSEWPENDIPPNELLQRLASETTSHKEKCQTVIECEVIAFPPEHIGLLRQLLYRFVQDYRDSDSQEDSVAVGCAIRKYVATMSRDDLSRLAVLLDAQHNVTIPIEVELEIVKTMLRKLVQCPADTPDIEPRLAERLCEIVELYLNPRLLARDKYAAVALNAILSLCLLRSTYADRVLQSLQTLNISWFTELVGRRALQIQETLQRAFSKEQSAVYGEQLISLNRALALCTK